MTPWHIQDMPITQHSSLLPRDHPLRSELSLPPTSYARTTRIPVMRMEHAEEAISSAQLSFCGRASAATMLSLEPLVAHIGSHPTHDPSHSASASLLRCATLRLWPVSGAASSGASDHLLSLWAALGAPPSSYVISPLHPRGADV